MAVGQGWNPLAAIARTMHDTSKMTDRSRSIQAIADQRARNLACEVIAPEHLLFALAAEDNGLAANVLRDLGGASKFIQDALSAGRIASLDGATTQLPWDDTTKRAIEQSAAETTPLQHYYIGTEHLILGLSVVSPELFERTGIHPAKIRTEVYAILGYEI